MRLANWLTELVAGVRAAGMQGSRKARRQRHMNELLAQFSTQTQCEVLEDRALLSVTTYNFESPTSGTSFTSSGQTWTLTGVMAIQNGTDLGAPPSGSASPSTPGYADTVFGVNRTPGTNVGGIKAPTVMVFRADSFDVWPSHDGGNNVYGGTNNTLGTVGLTYTLIGKLSGSQVVSATVTDTA